MNTQIQTPHKASFFVKAFISYVYFIQGIFLSLGGTITILYPVFPDLDVLSTFSLAALPFSFKYVTAPIVERYTFPKYGRRKFWIVASMIASTFLSFPLIRNLTNQEQHKQVVGILFVILLAVSMGDISIDAASVKQLNNPVLSSNLQLGFQSLGNIAGGWLLVRLTSPSDWILFKTEHPFCTPETFILIIGILNGVVGILIHFFYRQRVLKEQETQQAPSFKKIFRFFTHFVNPKYKLCRFVLYLFLHNQGIKFFKIGFEPEAVYRGFPKQKLPQIHTYCIFIAMAMCIFMSRFIDEKNLWQMMRKTYIVQLLVLLAIFCFDSFSYEIVYATIIINTLMHLMSFLLVSTKINTFGESQLAGVCITTLASFLNLGNNGYLQQKVTASVGYYPSVIAGFVLASLFALFYNRIADWVQNGQPERAEWIEIKQQ